MKGNYLKKTNDFMWIMWSKLTGLNSCWGFIIYDNGVFSLDRKKWIDFIRMISNSGANATRLMPYAFWKFDRDDPESKDKERFTPYQYNETKKKWNLIKFNKYYFDILKEMFDIAKDFRITIHWCLFDNCQLHNKFKTPWKNNVQGAKTFYNQWELAKLWVDTFLLEFKDYDIFYSLGNELVDEGVGLQVAVDFCTNVRQYLLDNNVNPENMDYGFTISDIIFDINLEKYVPIRRPFAADAVKKRTFKPYYGTTPDGGLSSKGRKIRKQIMRVTHGIGEYNDIAPELGLNVPAVLSWYFDAPHDTRYILSTDGTRHAKGKSCDIDIANNKVRPGVVVWNNIMDEILKNRFVKWGSVGVEQLTTKKTGLACQQKILMAISERYKKHIGKYPKNRKKPIDKIYQDIDEKPIPDEKEDEQMVKKTKGIFKELFEKWYGKNGYIQNNWAMIIFILMAFVIVQMFFPELKYLKWFRYLLILGFLFEPIKKSFGKF